MDWVLIALLGGAVVSLVWLVVVLCVWGRY